MSVASAVYEAIITECERLQMDGKYTGNGHHLAQRLAGLVAAQGRLITTYEAGQTLGQVVEAVTGAPWKSRDLKGGPQ